MKKNKYGPQDYTVLTPAEGRAGRAVTVLMAY